MTATAWNLTRAGGRSSRCLIKDADGGWDVIVWNGPSIVVWERQPAHDAALARADELWSVLVANGSVPEDDYLRLIDGHAETYRRACPECDARAGRVTHIRGSYMVLACEACQHSWNDRRRTSVCDRRLTPRDQQDRRRAA